MRSEDQLFDKVRASLHDYAPEVPASVYSGMRRKLWWSNFMRFQAHRLNVWYVVLLVGAGATAWCSTACDVQQIATQTPANNAPAVLIAPKPEETGVAEKTAPEMEKQTERTRQTLHRTTAAQPVAETASVAAAVEVENVAGTQNAVVENATTTEPSADLNPSAAVTATPANEPQTQTAAPVAKSKKGRSMKVTVYEKKN